MVIWKSNLSDKINAFFPISLRINTAIWMFQVNTDYVYGERERERSGRKLYKNPISCNEQVIEAIFHKRAAVGASTTHHKNHPN